MTTSQKTTRSRRLTPEQKQIAIQMFLAGSRFPEIARFCEKTPTAIKTMLNKLGHFAAYTGKVSKLIEQDICKEYVDDDISITELMKKYNISRTVIRCILLRHNIVPNNQKIVQRKYTLNHDFFEKIDTPEKAYILGLLYADGCCSPKNRKITLSLKQSDKSILEKINTVMGSNKPLYYRPPQSKIQKNGKMLNSHGHYVLAIISEKICDDLSRWGIHERKSLNLTWPSINELFIRDFIRGFFDGDGGLSKNGVVSFPGNYEFLSQLKGHLMKYLNTPDNKLSQHSISKVQYYSFGAKKDLMSFYTYLYPFNVDMFIARKKELFESLLA